MKSDPPPTTTSVALCLSERDGMVVEEVSSTVQQDLPCPYCSGRRRPNGRRVVRYRDIPIDGKPRSVDWHRQYYRCVACGRASIEESPDFEKDRFLTRRFVEWIKAKSRETTLASIAKEAGMNQVFLRRLFHNFTVTTSSHKVPTPTMLGVASIQVAGSARPALVDVEKHILIDVFTSIAGLKEFLANINPLEFDNVGCVVRDVEFDTPNLMTTNDLRGIFPNLQLAVISSRSIARASAALMVALSEPFILATAMAENKSPISVRKLFARRNDNLKKSASGRIRKWQQTKETEALFHAYDLKERFLQIWLESDGLKEWRNWLLAIGELPEQRFQPVAALIEQRWSEVTPCFAQPIIFDYERWLDDVRNFEIKGTHSFAAAKQALLAKFNQSNETFKPRVTKLSHEEDRAIANMSNVNEKSDKSG